VLTGRENEADLAAFGDNDAWDGLSACTLFVLAKNNKTTQGAGVEYLTFKSASSYWMRWQSNQNFEAELNFVIDTITNAFDTDSADEWNLIGFTWNGSTLVARVNSQKGPGSSIASMGVSGNDLLFGGIGASSWDGETAMAVIMDVSLSDADWDLLVADPLQVFERGNRLLPSGTVAGIKLFFRTITGALAPAGTLVKRTFKSFTGAMTPSGALTTVRLFFRTVSGALTPVGVLVRKTFKSFAGSLTPSGIVIAVKAIFKSISGSLTPIGALTKETAKSFSGSLVPAGVLVKRTLKALAGALTPSGIVAGIKIAVLAISGALAPAGTLVKRTLKNVSGSLSPSGILATATQFFRTLAGSLTPSGALIKRTFKSFAGSLTPSAILTTAATFARTIAGSLTPSGALTKETQKAVAGTLSPSGTITRDTFKLLFASMTPSGDLSTIVIFTQLVTGVLALAGSLGTTFIPGGGAIGRIYRRLLTVINHARSRKSDD